MIFLNKNNLFKRVYKCKGKRIKEINQHVKIQSKKSKSKTNKAGIQINDFDNEITSKEKEVSQNEDEVKTIFNLTFKFDKKYMPLKI